MKDPVIVWSAIIRGEGQYLGSSPGEGIEPNLWAAYPLHNVPVSDQINVVSALIPRRLSIQETGGGVPYVSVLVRRPQRDDFVQEM